MTKIHIFLLGSFLFSISSCYPQQGVASNDNLGGSNNINNLYMRQQPARGHHYYNHQPHYYYPGYWRPLGSAPPAPPAFQTPSFPVPVPVQQQVQPPQIGTGCSGNMACASACMKNSYYNGWGYQQPYYPAVPNQDIDDKNSTTAEPEPEVAGCQYSDCSIGRGYYGSSCGLRAGFNYGGPSGRGGNSLCGATGGWPSSYCGNGNDWNYNTPTAFCDNNLCSSDCQNLGQNGGYCEKDKCFCFKQVYKPKIQTSLATSDNSVDSA